MTEWRNAGDLREMVRETEGSTIPCNVCVRLKEIGT